MRVCYFALAIVLAAMGAIPACAQPEDDLAALNRRVLQLYQAGKYAEAVPIAERALAHAERVNGADHPAVALAVSNLAMLHHALGRYTQAELLYKRALAASERTLRPDDPELAAALHNLGQVYKDQGRYAQAEPLYERALAIAEKAPDRQSLVATILANLGGLYEYQSRYADAETFTKRAITVGERAHGAEHPTIATYINNLARMVTAQGRPLEAEPLIRRALAIREKVLGPDHPHVAASLIVLANHYQQQGRYAEAEQLYKRTIEIFERALGPDHRYVGQAIDALASMYQSQGRYAESAPLFRRSIAITEKALGPDHPDFATALANFAMRLHGQPVEAEALYKRALAIREKALGPDHPFVATNLNNLAFLYRQHGRYAEAEPLMDRVVKMREESLGREHPDVAVALMNSAALAIAQGKWAQAVALDRRATAIAIARSKREGDSLGRTLTGKGRNEVSRLNYAFRELIGVAARLSEEDRTRQPEFAREMFEMAQWAHASTAAASLAQMAVRTAKGEGLGSLVRERQDLVAEWQQREQAQGAAVAQPPANRDRVAEAANLARLTEIEAKIAVIDKRLAADFPEYAALANPEPLPVASVQAQLSAGEALVVFLHTPRWERTPEEMFLWVVTKTEVRWVPLDLRRKGIADRVAALRCGLDHTLWAVRESAERCRKMLGASPVKETVMSAGGKGETVQVLPFDLARAHELYTVLLGPVEDLIKGKHLLMVPSGPLTSLPFHVLVTKGGLPEHQRSGVPPPPTPPHQGEGSFRLPPIAAQPGSGRASPSPCCPRSPRSRRCASSPRPAAPASLISASAIRCSRARRITRNGVSTTSSRPGLPATSDARGRLQRCRLPLLGGKDLSAPLIGCFAEPRPTSRRCGSSHRCPTPPMNCAKSAGGWACRRARSCSAPAPPRRG